MLPFFVKDVFKYRLTNYYSRGVDRVNVGSSREASEYSSYNLQVLSTVKCEIKSNTEGANANV
jgi:hypothetical protein